MLVTNEPVKSYIKTLATKLISATKSEKVENENIVNQS